MSGNASLRVSIDATYHKSGAAQCSSHTASRAVDEIGLDWGVETFATIAHLDGTYSALENPRFVRNAAT